MVATKWTKTIKKNNFNFRYFLFRLVSMDFIGVYFGQAGHLIFLLLIHYCGCEMLESQNKISIPGSFYFRGDTIVFHVIIQMR